MMSIDIALSAMQAAMKPTNSPKAMVERDLGGMISFTGMEKREFQRCRLGRPRSGMTEHYMPRCKALQNKATLYRRFALAAIDGVIFDRMRDMGAGRADGNGMES
jgi:hypothetical protein